MKQNNYLPPIQALPGGATRLFSTQPAQFPLQVFLCRCFEPVKKCFGFKNTRQQQKMADHFYAAGFIQYIGLDSIFFSYLCAVLLIDSSGLPKYRKISISK